MRAGGGSTALDLRRAIALALLVFGISFVGYSRTLPPNADEMMNYALVESMAKFGAFDVDQVSTVGANPEEYGLGGHRYSKYGPAQAVLAVPLYWLAQRLPVGAVDTVLLENHILTGLVVGVVYLIGRRLGYGPLPSAIVALLACFTTPVWVAAKRFFGEPTTMLCVVLAWYFAIAARQTNRRLHLALAGTALGAAVAAKYVNVLILAPVALWLIVPDLLPTVRLRASGSWTVGLGKALWLAIGGAPVAALLGLYNWARFGNPLESGYARWEQFNTPLLEGAGGLLFSPGKSLFVYAPVLLLAVAWYPLFWRRHRWLAGLTGAVFALNLVVYGTWWVWWGAWAWGPRFLVPIVPVLALALLPGLAGALERRSRLGLGALGALAALGLGVQILGQAVDHTVYMAHLLPLNPRPDTLTLYDLSRSPILAQTQFLTRRWLDFAWVDQTGPTPLHVSALVATLASAAALAAAGWVLWRERAGAAAGAGALALTLVAAGCVGFALNRYYRLDEPALLGLAGRIANGPQRAVIVHLASDSLTPYSNVQKRSIRTIGWSEEPGPLNPRLIAHLDGIDASADYDYVWLVSQYPRRVPVNGIERRLTTSMTKVEELPAGRLRLALYRRRDSGASATRVEARFADGIRLLTAEAPAEARSREFAQITLVWSTDARVDQDLTVFVHLVGADGKLIAQDDSPPADGFRPTSGWQPGERVVDHHHLALPAGASLDGSTYYIGLYTPATGARVPIPADSGRPADDKVELRLASGRLVRQ